VPDGLPPLEVDAGQVQRALVNLLENALKFSRDGVLIAAAAAGSTVTIDVLDRGPGVDEAPSTARGLGLGLEIARGFAGLNDARIELSPREGGGTRARVAFSAAPVHA
jgi:two-component system sensor histidine kinase KdpD